MIITTTWWRGWSSGSTKRLQNEKKKSLEQKVHDMQDEKKKFMAEMEKQYFLVVLL